MVDYPAHAVGPIIVRLDVDELTVVPHELNGAVSHRHWIAGQSQPIFSRVAPLNHGR
jgi:hypothetical protein